MCIKHSLGRWEEKKTFSTIQSLGQGQLRFGELFQGSLQLKVFFCFFLLFLLIFGIFNSNWPFTIKVVKQGTAWYAINPV